MADKYRYEVRVTGNEIAPESLAMEEIANFLVTVEELVAAVVEHSHPDLDFQKGGVLRLSSLTEGSLNLACSTPYKEAGPALRMVGSVAEDGDCSRLPIKARAAVLKLLKFSKDHNTSIDFREADGERPQLILLTPETNLSTPDDPALISGTATLYGELRRIGGEHPKAYIRLFIDGEIHSCEVNTPDLAQEIAKHLYKVIGVRGSAKWEVETLKLCSFCIEELMEYRQTSLTEAFESLSEVAAKHYADLEDVDAFVADLRGRGPEDE